MNDLINEIDQLCRMHTQACNEDDWLKAQRSDDELASAFQALGKYIYYNQFHNPQQEA
jgi:hypothetical protein